MSDKFDLTYVTTDSVQEAVGASQITPLLSRLAQSGLKISLISLEKRTPPNDLMEQLNLAKINWNPLAFGRSGDLGLSSRIYSLVRQISDSNIIHGRSDFGAIAGILGRKGPVLWDVRSLWSDQKAFIEGRSLSSPGIRAARAIEGVVAGRAAAISTLTNAAVPVLESRHRTLPQIRSVVPTIADLNLFNFNEIMPKELKVLYSGTYNNYYDLELSNNFVEQFMKKVPLEVIWARPLEGKNNNSSLHADSILTVNRLDMPALIEECSFGMAVCKIDAGDSLRAAAPTKIAEFLGSGRPVVVSKGLGDYEEIFRQYKAGVILDGTPKNLDHSASELIELIQDKETPFRCREVAEKFVSLNAAIENYTSVYNQIMNPRFA